MNEKAISLTDPGYLLAQALTMPQGPDSTMGETPVTFPKAEGYPEAAFLIRGLPPHAENGKSVRTAEVQFIGKSATGEEIVGSFSASGKPLSETVVYSRFQPDIDTASSAK